MSSQLLPPHPATPPLCRPSLHCNALPRPVTASPSATSSAPRPSPYLLLCLPALTDNCSAWCSIEPVEIAGPAGTVVLAAQTVRHCLWIAFPLPSRPQAQWCLHHRQSDTAFGLRFHCLRGRRHNGACSTDSQTLPLDCVFTAFSAAGTVVLAAQTLPLACVSTAFAAEIVPLFFRSSGAVAQLDGACGWAEQQA